MNFDFSDKTIFVAGGTSGINLGIAESFAKADARVFVMSRSRDKVDAAVSALAKVGQGGAAGAAGAPADVRDLDQVLAAFAQCADRFGQIDVLISGAAGNFPARALDISTNGFKAVMEIDVLGTHHVLTAGYPHLAKPGASVINISAPQSLVPMIGQVHVCAAKAGVDMITRTLALEWGPDGVRVNAVIPGPIADTEGMARLAPEPADEAAVIDSVPLRRLGTASDIGDACLFLGSDMAGYISGAIIPVDGGWALDGAGTSLNAILTPLTAK
jgi:NAD(P)-dependent dehydrogenase (short-subunit alcohol dehydrogenase family)